MSRPSRSNSTFIADAELLRQVVEEQDSTALEKLIEKHSRLVMGVCGQILKHSHDAEEAFQSTFLKLVEQAGAIKDRQSVANWLFRVAQNESRQVLRKTKRYPVGVEQTELERTVIAKLNKESEADLLVLFEEVERLPEAYQDSVLLCCLQGRTQQEAAEELGLTTGAVKARLARGREFLKKRLLKRGIGLAAVLATWETSQAVAGTIVTSTVLQQTAVGCLNQSATTVGGASLSSSTVTKGATWMAISSGKKIVIGVTLLLTTLGGGVAMLPSPVKEAPEAPPEKVIAVTEKKLKPPKKTKFSLTMDELILKVQEQEAHYQKLEQTTKSVREYFGPKVDPLPNSGLDPRKSTDVFPTFGTKEYKNLYKNNTASVKITRHQNHLITQNGKFILSSTREDVYSVISKSSPKKQRYLVQRIISSSKYDGKRMFQFNKGYPPKNFELTDLQVGLSLPQQSILDYSTAGLPFSTVLKGIDNFRTPYMPELQDRIVSSRIIEEKVLNNEKVIIVECNSETLRGREQATTLLTLNVEKNYIPSHASHWTINNIGERNLIAEYKVKSWKELKPGIWLPKEIDTQYDNKQSGNGQWKESKSPTKFISRDINYPDSFFHVEAPDVTEK